MTEGYYGSIGPIEALLAYGMWVNGLFVPSVYWWDW